MTVVICDVQIQYRHGLKIYKNALLLAGNVERSRKNVLGTNGSIQKTYWQTQTQNESTEV